MTAYDSPGSFELPTTVKRVKIIAVGEGGTGTQYSGATATNGDDGTSTTVMGVTAFGGDGGNAATGGSGGGSSITVGTIITSISGEDGVNGSATGMQGGIGHTFTSPSLGVSTYHGEGGNGSSSSYPSCTNGPYSGWPYRGGCGPNACSNAGPAAPDAWYYCFYPTTTPVYGGGGGAGGFIEAEISGSDLDQYYGTVNYAVNSGGSELDSGFLEIIFLFSSVYIKTSMGWQLVRNIYVKQSSEGVGWTTCAASPHGPYQW